MNFDKMRKEAFRRLKISREKADEGLQFEIAIQTQDSKCRAQMQKDLEIYPLYDGVAMWMDDGAGLAKYFPKDMERVALLLRLGHEELPIFRFEGGITERSKKAFISNRKELGKVRKVIMRYSTKRGDYVTTVVGEKGVLLLDGFSTGYGGEGPHGLIWLLEQGGIAVNGEYFGRNILGAGPEKGVDVYTLSAGALPCTECENGLMIRAPEKDKPFDEKTFGGEGFWEAWECDSCGRVYHEPFD